MARMAYSLVAPYIATVDDLPTPLQRRTALFQYQGITMPSEPLRSTTSVPLQCKHIRQ